MAFRFEHFEELLKLSAGLAVFGMLVAFIALAGPLLIHSIAPMGTGLSILALFCFMFAGLLYGAMEIFALAEMLLSMNETSWKALQCVLMLLFGMVWLFTYLVYFRKELVTEEFEGGLKPKAETLDIMSLAICVLGPIALGFVLGIILLVLFVFKK